MKKSILLVLFALVSMGAFSQVSWSIKGGLNLSTYYGDKSDNSKIKIGGRAGLGMEYAIDDMVSIEPSIYFTDKGAKNSNNLDAFGVKAGADVTYNQLYMEMPVNIKFRFALDKGTNFTIAAGPYIAYGIGGNTTSSENFDILGYKGKVSSDKVGTFDDDGPNLKRFDTGLNLETGLEFDSFLVGIYSEFGVYNLKSGGPENLNFGISVGYKF